MSQSYKKGRGAGGFFLIVLIVIGAIIVFGLLDEESEKPPRESASGTEDTEAYSGYRLEFSEEFNRAVASQDDLGVSIVVAIDCSGSMSDKLSGASESTPKYKLASESLTEVVDFLENFYDTRIKSQKIVLKLGLLRFSDTVQSLYSLAVMDKAHFAEIRAIASNPDVFTPQGKTAIGDTLAAGTEMLAQSGTIFKSLIIITDGENTFGESPETVLEAIVNNKNNKSTKDFPVFTDGILVSFIGFDLESSVFDDLHTIGSRVMSAGNKVALNDSLKNLFLADITKLESK